MSKTDLGTALRAVSKTDLGTARRTALHDAAESGDAAFVASLLLERDSQLDARDSNGLTPLYLAAQSGHAEIVSSLLAAGASANAVGRFGRTPLHRAVRGGHISVVRALLSSPGTRLNDRQEGGDSALHEAASNGHTEIVELLIAAGADVNAANDLGETPLHYAKLAAEGEHAAEENDGTSSESRAFSERSLATAKALCAAGANPNAKTNAGLTPG